MKLVFVHNPSEFLVPGLLRRWFKMVDDNKGGSVKEEVKVQVPEEESENESEEETEEKTEEETQEQTPTLFESAPIQNQPQVTVNP